MNIPLFDPRREYATIKNDIDRVISETLASGRFIGGEVVRGFESRFASFLGADAAAGVNSGTDALRLALTALGIGPGDEVIAPANTFTATIMAIQNVGATPVLVDVDPSSYMMTPSTIEPAVTRSTRAIIPVHLYGATARMDKICELARSGGLFVVEDAAQAHGAEFLGRRVGTWGDAGCFSFYPSKNLGAYGDGGAVVGSNGLAEKVRMLRDLGRDEEGNHVEVGINSRLDALQAGILDVKLAYLDKWIADRRALASRYDEAFAGTRIVGPIKPENGTHVYHLYVVRVSDRAHVLDAARTAGIEVGIHYPVPVHHQPAHVGRVKVPFETPVTEALASEIASLPLFPQMTTDEQDRVIDIVHSAVGG